MEAPPQWFTDGCATPQDRGVVEVEGCHITYRAWGELGRPVVVLVHGGAAHAGWWDHIGPYLANGRHRVVALDLSGHGDSGHRTDYDISTWATEVLAVAAAQSDQPPTLVGHSMGGLVVLSAGSRTRTPLRGVVAVDIVAESHGPGGLGPTPRPRGMVHRVHETREQALRRFRTLPDDEASLTFVGHHLAASSIKRVDGGWTWKFDLQIMSRPRMTLSDFAPVTCAAAVIRGERGLGSAEDAQQLSLRLGPDVSVTTILDAGHHIMLDQPIALIAALQSLLGQWGRSDQQDTTQDRTP